MDKNNKKLYLCDPNKNIECKKTDCGHLGTGKCFCTTNKDYMAEGYLIEVKTNQDKLAEMVRTMDPEILAKYIRESVVCGEDCPVMDICKPKKGETCYDLIELWLKEDAE